MQYCAVCLIAKDENKYLREWAEYHLRIGFDALIIYDNGSVTPLAEELGDLIALGRVHVHLQESAPEGWIKTQGNAYTDCMTRYKDAYRWVAVIDSDEFIVLKKTRSIKEFLAEYECYGAVAAHWVLFGSSGRSQNTGKSQIFSFIHADKKESTTIKSIVQPRRVARFTGPHGPVLLPGFFAVSADHFPLEPEVYSAPFVDAGICINHYFMRSWEDYQKKIALKAKNNRPISSFSFEEEQARFSRKDMTLLQFYAPLKDTPIEKAARFVAPETVTEFVSAAMDMLEKADFTALEEYLCSVSLFFEDDPMIWILRAIASRMRGNLARALHCAREASKLSGSSTLYFELARIYQALGDMEKYQRAKAQAEYKKSVEDKFCA